MVICRQQNLFVLIIGRLHEFAIHGKHAHHYCYCFSSLLTGFSLDVYDASVKAFYLLYYNAIIHAEGGVQHLV